MATHQLFRLNFDIKPSDTKIEYTDSFLAIGSCFANEVGLKLQKNYFDININPHGILYNPVSIAAALSDYVSEKKYTETNLVQHNNMWHSLNHHGSFSDAGNKKCIEKINTSIAAGSNSLKKCRWLIVSFGSAYAYINRADNNVVANCHKLPQYNFEKKLLDVNDLLPLWTDLLKQLGEDLQIIFTISPVRYIRDGVAENNRSKAVLFSLVHSLIEKNTNCHYFPAFEIVVDELRDYRFYKDDLVHPNETAINYVYQKFCDTFFDNTALAFSIDADNLNKLISHKPLDEYSLAHHQSNIEQQRMRFAEKYTKIKSGVLNSQFLNTA